MTNSENFVIPEKKFFTGLDCAGNKIPFQFVRRNHLNRIAIKTYKYKYSVKLKTPSLSSSTSNQTN